MPSNGSIHATAVIWKPTNTTKTLYSSMRRRYTDRISSSLLTSGPSKTMATGAESRVVGPQQIIKLIISTTGCGTEWQKRCGNRGFLSWWPRTWSLCPIITTRTNFHLTTRRLSTRFSLNSRKKIWLIFTPFKKSSKSSKRWRTMKKFCMSS